SSNNSIEVDGNIAINNTLEARDNITINGSCPNPDSLKLTSTRRGRIIRPQYAAPSATNPVIDEEDKELALAIKLSLESNKASSSSPAKVGIFAGSEPNRSGQASIPKSFICPLSKQLMEDPVLYTGDGNSYEKSVIEARMQQHPDYPKLDKAQIDSVLIPNRALKKSIEEFKEQNSNVFQTRLNM
ncbi:MAG: U-box domain-containing protein, partial [Legionella sp.]